MKQVVLDNICTWWYLR